MALERLKYRHAEHPPVQVGGRQPVWAADGRGRL